MLCVCISNPAYLTGTNCCHTQTHIGEYWDLNPCKARKDSTQCVFLTLLPAVRCKRQLVSTAISAHHCHVLSHYLAALSGVASASDAVLNFEMDRPSVGCQIASSKWPAYSPSLSTLCRRLPWHKDISRNQTQSEEWKETPTDRTPGEEKYIYFFL